MKVFDENEIASEENSGGIFEGGLVYKKPLVNESKGAEDIETAVVTFSPGARTKMHVHDHEQILYVLSGEGIVANEEEEFVGTPGKIFLIPKGEEHWHGATDESSFSHLYIFSSETETTY